MEDRNATAGDRVVSRRRVVSVLCLSLSATAGCLDLSDDENEPSSEDPAPDTPTPPPAATPTPDPTPTPDEETIDVTVAIGDGTVAVEDTVEVPLRVDASQSATVRGFDVTVTYDSDALAFDAAVDGAFADPVVNDTTDGSVSLNAVDVDGHETPLEPAAALGFEARVEGETTVQLDEGDADVSLEGATAAVSVEAGTVTVTE